MVVPPTSNPEEAEVERFYEDLQDLLELTPKKDLRVPWTARRSNQSILSEISPGISLEGLILKLKLWYLATSCEELPHWKRL